MEPRVRDWMTPDPVSLTPSESVRAALLLMVERAIRHLPVVDAHRRPVGLVSLDDLRAALPFPVDLIHYPAASEQADAEGWVVADLMTHAPSVVTADEPLRDAATSLAVRRIGCLPVVDEAGVLAGILTEVDALRALAYLLRGQPESAPAASEERALVESLETERTRIAARLGRLEHGPHRDSQEQPVDRAERAAELQDLQLRGALAERAAARLKRIEHALERAREQVLLRCEGCGGRIPVGRLRALPSATLCVACARADEERGEARPSR